MDTCLSFHVMNNQSSSIIQNRLVLIAVDQVRTSSIPIAICSLFLFLMGNNQSINQPIERSSSNDGNAYENVTLFYLCYLMIISTRPTSTETVNYSGTKLVGVVFELIKRMKNSLSCAHLLRKTFTL